MCASERRRAAKHDSVATRAARREFKAPGVDSLIAQRLTSKEVCQADYYGLTELLVRMCLRQLTVLPAPLTTNRVQVAAAIVLVAETVLEVGQALVARTPMSFIPAGLGIGAVVCVFWSLLQVLQLSSASAASLLPSCIPDWVRSMPDACMVH